MEVLPKTKKERRIVIALLLLAAALLIIARAIWFTPDNGLVAKDLFDSLITTILVTVVLAIVLRWLDINSKFDLESRILYPAEIGSELEDAADKASEWEYRGGCGRYQRFAVLPKLAETATKTGRGRDAYMELLDPDNEPLCESYAAYRNKRKSGVGKWTAKRVRLEVLATIFSAYKYSKNSNLDVEVYLSASFSLFRVDLSDKGAILTQEDAMLPALKLIPDSYYYREIQEDLRISRSLSKAVPIQAANAPIQCADTLRQVGGLLQISLNGLGDDDIGQLLTLINEPEAPYK